ncbi:hypothetical protein AL518_05430 [Hafnia paralvei]|jgi:hypothetical protein|nr:hypothetical protein AL518_05430 [Hafnia paralvei]TBM05026.1 hypothetical protein EYY87_10240 [Hafnia paralvei]TBM26836.1 hypothetical protein EYY85_11110 [Hafnia paralvei]
MDIVNVTRGIISSLMNIHFPFSFCVFNEQIYLLTEDNQRYIMRYVSDPHRIVTCQNFDCTWEEMRDYSFEIKTSHDLHNALFIGHLMGWWTADEVLLLKTFIKQINDYMTVIEI